MSLDNLPPRPAPAPRLGEDEFEGEYRGAGGVTRGIVWSDLVAEMNADRREAPYEAAPVAPAVLDLARRRAPVTGVPLDDEERAA